MALILPAYKYDAGAGLVTINFTEPLADDDVFGIRAAVRDTFGGSGKRQRHFDFNEEVLTLHHKYVPEAELTSVITMMRDWVLRGNTFDFYHDQTVGTFFTLECLDKTFDDFDRMFANLTRFEFKINVRKYIA